MRRNDRITFFGNLGYGFLSFVLLVSSLVLLPAWASASGNVYFVSSGGSNGTGTQSNPFNSIAAALSAASNDDIIEISAGNFDEDLAINKRLTIRCANAGVSAGATAGARGTETVIEGQAVVSVANVVIDGCHFTRPAGLDRFTAAPKLISSATTTGQITVQNSKLDMTFPGSVSDSFPNGLSACGAGVSGTAAWRVFNSELKNLRYANDCAISIRYGSRAIFADSAQRIVVSGNRFFNTGQGVFITGSTADGSEITGNIFTSPGTAGVFLGAPQNVIIKGNTFAGYGGVYLDSSVGTIVENNLFNASNYFALYVDNNATSGTILRNNAILGAYPAGSGVGFEGKTVFNNSLNPISAQGNWWGDGRSPSTLVGGSNSAGVTVTPTLSFTGSVDLNAIGFFPSGTSSGTATNTEASHTVTYSVAPTRSIAVEGIGGGDITVVALGTVPETGTSTAATQVQLRITADDAINSNSPVKVTVKLDAVDPKASLQVSAAVLSNNDTYTALTPGTVQLSTSDQDVITEIFSKTGVRGAISALTYTLTTTGAAVAATVTRTVTYTLTDD
jgi:hypothetical protein